MHEHNNCKHEGIKVCFICDRAYCPDCKKEWWSYQFTWSSPAITYTNIPNTITCGVANTTCSH